MAWATEEAPFCFLPLPALAAPALEQSVELDAPVTVEVELDAPAIAEGSVELAEPVIEATVELAFEPF